MLRKLIHQDDIMIFTINTSNNFQNLRDWEGTRDKFTTQKVVIFLSQMSIEQSKQNKSR